MKNQNQTKPGIQKVRRIAAGCKPADGRLLQALNRKVKRADPRKIRIGGPDGRLTAFAGLVAFGRHLRRCGFDEELERAFGHMKQAAAVVYPMPVQIRNFIDAQAVGEPRVFGFEHLARDPLFVKLCGGHVPSIDTLYRDLGRTFRVVAVRSKEKYTGKQIQLWPELDWVVEAYITNDFQSDADFIAVEYQQRARVELLIRQWKYGLGMGAMPRADFHSNHAMLLLKLLTHNLMQDFFASEIPQLSHWRIEWLRRLVICVPGRLLRRGNSYFLKLPGHSPLYHLLC